MTRIPANGTTYHYFNKAARAARLSLFRHVGDSRLKRSLLPLLSKNMPGHSAWAFQSVCALHSEVLASRVFCVWLGAGLRPWRQPMSSSATTPGAKVVGLGGLEPPASPLSGVRSNHLSYRPGCFSGGA